MSTHCPDRFRSLRQLQSRLRDNEPQVGTSYQLERMEQAVERLEHPERRYRVVHVGGTSGKGSTCQMIYSILQAAGYSVGIYTSPALITQLERIAVNGKQISERVFLRMANSLWPIVQDLKLTHFEFFTLLAFNYFAQRQVEYAVIEVGVGGKFDATNVVQPTIALVTEVGLDHVELLGDTLKKIAQDKQAIIKPPGLGLTGTPLIRLGTYIDRSKARIIETTLTNTIFSYKQYKRLRLNTIGSYQIRNAVLAIEAARRLHISGAAIRSGLQRVSHPGRFEVIRRRPLIIADGAHNPQKMTAFVASLKQVVPLKRQSVICLCSIKYTKDLYHTLKPLLPLVDELILTTFPKSASMSAMKRIAQQLQPQLSVKSIGHALSAYHYFRSRIQPLDVGIITGSLYLIGKLYPVL